jgi:hypothetical protein
MYSKLSHRMALALASLVLCLGGSVGLTAQAAVTANLTIDKGCGSTSYKVGDPISINFGATQPMGQIVHLTLALQNGSARTTLFDRDVTAPAQFQINGTIGQPAGQMRTLSLTASASGMTPQTLTCTFTPGANQATLTGSVSTQNGCGVTFQVGQEVDFVVTSSQPADFNLVLQKPNGVSLTFTGSVPAGTTTVSTGTAGLPVGMRTLSLMLRSRTTGQTFTAPTCSYNVVQQIGFAPTRGGSR